MAAVTATALADAGGIGPPMVLSTSAVQLYTVPAEADTFILTADGPICGTHNGAYGLADGADPDPGNVVTNYWTSYGSAAPYQLTFARPYNAGRNAEWPVIVWALSGTPTCDSGAIRRGNAS